MGCLHTKCREAAITKTNMLHIPAYALGVCVKVLSHETNQTQSESSLSNTMLQHVVSA